ncbi:MAG: Protein of unknown function (DUF3007) [Phormidesmis priestleyi Ana]|uniref:DUF3007 family protein n=1 Tax=Phormidesmis priestleyi Ana TaxID=1666911 RepID=A0A0P7YZT1_9CYAN|nr:MAG: Protein of unknown function (DUF3007) [Phormidesmis priestleyi Ana]
MRRIDVIGIGIGVFAAGGLLYLAFAWAGLDGISAGIWSQVVFVAGLLGWTGTYVARALGKKMTYNQQLEDYEEAVLQKRLEEMSPEELAQIQAEVEQARQAQADREAVS